MRERTNILWLDSIDSTNNEVRRRSDCLDNLSVIAAHWQSGGRGQGDHAWYSAPGMNLTFSLFLRFHKCICNGGCTAEMKAINDCMTALICRFLQTEGIEAWVKMPNDIWVNDKKICGILIENTLDGGHIVSSITGIGLNLNQTDFPEYLPNPVSLKQLTGRDYSPETVLESLLDIFEREFPVLAGTDADQRDSFQVL